MYHGYNFTGKIGTTRPFLYVGELPAGGNINACISAMACMIVLGLAALTHFWPQKTKLIVPLLGGLDTI